MIRVWFNHWFSTAYYIIKMLKDTGDYCIIGTNENEFASYKIVCDEWYNEPVLKDDEYVDFCLGFCKEHDIKVFVPRRHMLAISRRKKKFIDLGTMVLAEDYDLISIFNYKSKAYENMRIISSWNIPEYNIVNNSDDFLSAYNRLSEKYRFVCFKFEHYEGGKSFRLIDNQRKGYKALFKKQNTRMTLDDVKKALAEKETFAPIMIMPFLSGDEISADCLKTEKGRIIIPRVKSTVRYERIVYDSEILKMCNDFFDNFPLRCPCNIQFKYLDGIPYFLEVNTRMSGGIQLSCVAGEINIPDIAIKGLLGQSVDWKLDMKDKAVTNVEVPLVVD